MKRAKDRWINGHLAVGLLFLSCLVLPSVSAVKATSLFRTTTTTTTSAPAEQDETAEGVEPADPDATPPTNYTGIPQIDYIHDPNLPRELNGYNLSSYPFYETVPPPEEMDFKCDGLHDGFYASVPHKCQVYHHCLYGTRYDFLCANYTAFDQKTFICHFVSEVDCVNSPKYYHRNDALYIATTTSTAAPLTTTTTTTTAAPPQPSQSRPRGGGGRRRPPSRRPRPQYDYYDDDYYPSGRDDDYYEEERRSYGEGRGNRRRKRPRPRRPQYDEYEEDRYNRRPSRNRDDEEDEYEERTYERPRKSSRRPSDDKPRTDSRKQYDEDDDSRSYERPRKNFRPSEDRRNYDRPRRPMRDDDSRYDDRDDRTKQDKNTRDERPYRDERPMKDRPYRDDRTRYDDRRNRDDSSRDGDKLYAENKKPNDNVEPTANGGLVKPNGGSIYSKPRIPPKIARPVPTNEKDKYKYVPIVSTETSKVEEEEYYDDYDREDVKPTPQTSSSTYQSKPEQERGKYKPKERNRSHFERDAPKRPPSDASSKYKSRRPEVDESKKIEDTVEYVYEDEIEETKPKKTVEISRERYVPKNTGRKRPTKNEDDYIYEDERPSTSRKNERQRLTPERKRPSYNDDERSFKNSEENNKNKNSNADSDEGETDKEKVKSGYVRVIKRPFLPSRGGSPYLPRGLQPLGGKNFNKTQTPSTTSTTTQATTTVTTTTTTTAKPSPLDYSYETEYEVIDDKNMNQETYPDEYPQSDKEQTFENNKPQEPDYHDREPNPPNKHQNPEMPPQNIKPISKDVSFPEKPRPQYGNDEYNNNHKFQPSVVHKNPTVEKEKESEPVFRPSPQFTPPQKVTSKPYTPKIPENISIKQNLADPIENDYDVTINEALSPTLPNLTPIRSFPSPFASTPDRDYTFSRFRNNYQDNVPATQYNNYQFRSQPISPPNPFKYSTPRGGLKFAKNPDSSASASDSILVGVSVRTPQSFYIQQPRHPSTFSLDEIDSDVRPSHLVHRHIKKNDYHI